MQKIILANNIMPLLKKTILIAFLMLSLSSTVSASLTQGWYNGVKIRKLLVDGPKKFRSLKGSIVSPPPPESASSPHPSRKSKPPATTLKSPPM
ncbi:hypothetical protein CASFOL_002516 [Castilleja foliolosa]|uniref:Uncharacterized protein n=1 Tax=Castilleja foliolosa TaxID=1961234 RepID=A0ABD3EEW8_9LAMI